MISKNTDLHDLLLSYHLLDHKLLTNNPKKDEIGIFIGRGQYLKNVGSGKSIGYPDPQAEHLSFIQQCEAEDLNLYLMKHLQDM